MPFDLQKALSRVPAEKRGALEAALKEADGFISEVGGTYEALEKERTERIQWEAEKARIEENWNTANTEYLAMIEREDATKKERDAAALKLKEAEDKLKAAQIDPTKVVTPEDLDTRLSKFAASQTVYFGETLEAAAEVERVTKQRVSPKVIIQEAIAAKKTPMEYVEEKYELPKKREEAAKAQRETELNAARDEGYKKAVSEQANPATRTLSDSSSPFYVPATNGKQPWEQTETPAEETKLLGELITARVQ